MDQGVIATFKKYYSHYTFCQGMKVSGKSGTSLQQVWKGCNMYKSIKISTLLSVTLQLSPWTGSGRAFTHSLFMISMDLSRWMKSPGLAKSQSLSDPQETNELDLQEDDLLTSLLRNMRSLLMKTWWIWRPRERTKRAKRKKQLKNRRDSRCRKWQGDFMWGGAVSLWGAEPECRMVHEACNRCSECSLALLCHLWQEKKELLPRHHWVIFLRVKRFKSNKEADSVLSMPGVSEIAACPSPSIANNPSTLPSLTSSPSSSP